MFGVNKITVLRLLADAERYARFQVMKNPLESAEVAWNNVQLDEIWSFTHSKNKNVRDEDCFKGYGDTWTWCCTRRRSSW